MGDWQQSFLGKLESAKKQWLHRFEDAAQEHIEPAFSEFDEFTTSHGFTVSAPGCEAGTRLFKFGLTENGYLLLTFRLRGLDVVEANVEVFVPGPEHVAPVCTRKNLADVSRQWAREQFEQSLDRFIIAFGEASAACAENGLELTSA
jgi:hypothetical protein